MNAIERHLPYSALPAAFRFSCKVRDRHLDGVTVLDLAAGRRRQNISRPAESTDCWASLGFRFGPLAPRAGTAGRSRRQSKSTPSGAPGSHPSASVQSTSARSALSGRRLAEERPPLPRLRRSPPRTLLTGPAKPALPGAAARIRSEPPPRRTACQWTAPPPPHPPTPAPTGSCRLASTTATVAAPAAHSSTLASRWWWGLGIMRRVDRVGRILRLGASKVGQIYVSRRDQVQTNCDCAVTSP